MSEDVIVTTICADESQEQQARNAYQAAGVNMENVAFIHAPTDSIWIRDYGPWFIFQNNTMAIVDHIYNRPRPNDDVIPQVIGNEWNMSVYGMNLIHTGGNHMSDGIGMSMSTNLVYTENPDKSPQEIHNIMYQYLGNYYTLLEDIQQSGIHHIDCWAKFLSPSTILIKDVPPTDPTYNKLNEIAAYLASQISDWGIPYNIVRIYCPSGTYYTNSLILNNKVLVPLFNNPQDSIALQTYRDAMPGYEVIGFTGSWSTEDALHCRTMGVPDRGMLFIDHKPFKTEDITLGDYLIKTKIIPYSGANLISDELKIHYSIDNGPWNYTFLYQDIEPQQYYGYIPSQPEDSIVSYYLEAADESGRISKHPYIGQSWPHKFKAICPNHPIINVLPNGKIPVCPNTGKLLIANTTGGIGPFIYQWTEDGIDIPYANSDTYIALNQGSHKYNCKVWGNNCINPRLDKEDIELIWQNEPLFSGLASVINNNNSTCSLKLEWQPAIAACGGPITYNIYRSTIPNFTPSSSNLLISGIKSTYFEDNINLNQDTTYYYIVRAVDNANGYEDQNLIEKSGTPTGPISNGTWSENGEGSSSKFSISGLWHLSANNNCANPGYQSPIHSYYYGQESSCNYNTGSTNSGSLISIPIFNVSATSMLSFWSFLQTEQYGSGYDNAMVMISTDNGSNWITIDQDNSNGGNIPDNGAYWSLMSYSLASYENNDILLRFYFNTKDASYNNFKGWILDDISITNVDVPASCITSGNVSEVPDGTQIDTSPMLALKHANGILITWDTNSLPCRSSGYHLLWGWGNNIHTYQIENAECNLTNSGTYLWINAPDTSNDFCWFIIVGNNGSNIEGSWGDNSSGIQRSTSPSGYCGTSYIDIKKCQP